MSSVTSLGKKYYIKMLLYKIARITENTVYTHFLFIYWSLISPFDYKNRLFSLFTYFACFCWPEIANMATYTKIATND